MLLRVTNVFGVASYVACLPWLRYLSSDLVTGRPQTFCNPVILVRRPREAIGIGAYLGARFRSIDDGARRDSASKIAYAKYRRLLIGSILNEKWQE